jgi:hypothetical protein
MQAWVAQTYADPKPGAVPNAAGVLLKFAFRMQPGDRVVYPYRTGTVRIVGLGSSTNCDVIATIHTHRASIAARAPKIDG